MALRRTPPQMPTNLLSDEPDLQVHNLKLHIITWIDTILIVYSCQITFKKTSG